MSTNPTPAKTDKLHWHAPKQLRVIIFAAFLFFFATIITAGSTNTVFPFFAEIHDWDISFILVVVSIASYLGTVATFFLGRLAVKVGVMKLITPSLFIGGIAIAMWGITDSMVIFSLSIIVCVLCSNAYRSVGVVGLLNSWFPRTKGIVLGFATMGIILSDIIWMPYLPELLGSVGLAPTMIGVGVLFIIMGIVAKLFIKNTPEEAGTAPDGAEGDVEVFRASAAKFKNYKSTWTVKKLIKTPQVWQIAFGWGLLWFVAVCFLSQIVSRALSIGYDYYYAVMVTQMAAVASLCGSFIFGLIDLKLGTKKASLIYAVVNCLMFILSIFQAVHPAFLWISTCGMMAGVGGICNLIPSMIGTVFGRWDFTSANSVISFVVGLLVSSAFITTAIFISTGLGFDLMYALCAVIVVICFFIILKTKDDCIGKVTEE